MVNFMERILIVEDDIDIHSMLEKLLKLENYNVLNAYSGTEAMLILEKENIDLILLDLMLPGLNGEEIIKKIKLIPIIVISAKSDVDNKVKCLINGANDYITKPFNNQELLARIQVQLKNKTNDTSILNHKDIEMNTIDYKVKCNNKELFLTKNEFNLLKTLMEHPNQVLTKSMLFDLVWDNENSADDNTLNVHISKLRNKLKKCHPKEEYIETVWSIGYRLKK